MTPPKNENFKVSQIPDLSGYVAIVTGGNSGIGFETTFQLALHHARVYVAGRSRERCEEAILKMKSSSTNGKDLDLHFLHLDLQDLGCVKRAAEEFLRKESRLDLLFNNAAIFAVPFQLTTNGFEIQWQTNYLAPHLFFRSLLPLLRSTAATSPKDRVRVIDVSSDGAFTYGPKEVNYNNPNLESLTGVMATVRRYGHSKLAGIIHARAVHNRYYREGILSFAVSPGIVRTNILAANLTFFGAILRLAAPFMPMSSASDGARTSLFCASSLNAVPHSGGYFAPFGKLDHRPDKWTSDEVKFTRLWDASEKMLEDCGF